MNLDLSGRNILVCGSSKGIGKAVAFQLASLGGNITLAARSANKLKEICAQLDTSSGQNHNFLEVDFMDSDDLKSKIDQLVSDRVIHVLINNTGGPKGGAIIDAGTEEFVQAFHNHLVCNQILVQAVAAGMKRDRYGRIINIISTSVKQPIPGLGVSNTIRGAVASWSKTMATELGPHGITVNNILPGFTQTQRLDEIIDSRASKAQLPREEIIEKMKSTVPAGRFAKPEETANVVAFLASPAAAYINGINLPVDGGRTKSL